MKLIIAIGFLFAGTSNCEELPWKQILKAPEEEQVAFVKSYIAKDLMRSRPHPANEEREGALMMLLVNKGVSFIPLFVELIQAELPNDDPHKNGIVHDAVGCILSVRTVLAMETIERLFRNDKFRFDRYIQSALLASWGGRGSVKTILIWYSALKSSNPALRQAAAEVVQNIYGREDLLPHHYEYLAEAMHAHYGRDLADSEFLAAPVILAVESKSPKRAFDTRKMVSEITMRKKALK